MKNFTNKPSKFRKIQGGPAGEAAQDWPDVVEAIVKVNEPGYVPSGVKLRSRIDSQMLTGEVATDVLDQLERDPKVDAVSISRRLRVID